MNPHISIACPSTEHLHYKFVNSLINLMLGTTKDCQVSLANAVCSRITVNRNNLVELAKDNGCTHVLFVDSDMEVPSDSILRLLAHDKDIVGATACKRGDEAGVPIGTPRYAEDYGVEKDLIEMSVLGCALMLIKMEAFDKLQRPYFAEPPKDGVAQGEDAYFCEMATAAGLSVWCDMKLSMDIAHWGSKGYKIKSVPKATEIDFSSAPLGIVETDIQMQEAA